MNYKTYAWIGLVGFVLSFVLPVLINLEEFPFFTPIFEHLYQMISYFAIVVFIWAFIKISNKLKNNLLLVGTVAQLILFLLISLLNIFSLFINIPSIIVDLQDPSTAMNLGIEVQIVTTAFLIIVGSFTIIKGIGFLKLKREFGSLVIATGIFNIITGVLFATVFLFFIGVFAFLTAFILEIILLFKADKQID